MRDAIPYDLKKRLIAEAQKYSGSINWSAFQKIVGPQYWAKIETQMADKKVVIKILAQRHSPLSEPKVLEVRFCKGGATFHNGDPDQILIIGWSEDKRKAKKK